MIADTTLLVPARNEGARLTRFLGELADMLPRAPQIAEVILVLDGCTDDSIERAREKLPRFGDDAPLRILDLPPSGKSGAVRSALLSARGRYTLLWDADCEYGLAALPACAQSLSVGTLVCGVRQSGRGWKSRFADAASHLVLWLSKLFEPAASPRTADMLTGVHGAETAWMLDVLEDIEGYALEAALVRAALDEGRWLYDVPVPYLARTKAQGRGIRWYHLWSILRAALGVPAYLEKPRFPR
ncbi:MAG: glycosyltransferase [Sinobacteraceae bacterium]|nr:glycosyltransferase [Nevskiaceae bacterium]